VTCVYEISVPSFYRKRLLLTEWYAVHTKPHKEFLTRDALARIEGVQVYLPTLRVEPVNPRSRKIRPFFRGYLFVHADLAQVGLSEIQWQPGVSRVVDYGGEPVSIPAPVIEEIRRKVEEVQLLEQDFGAERFRQGDRVRVTKGPFEGFEGMFDTRIGGQARARILVDFLGRLTATDLDVRYLEKLPPSTRLF
jgi:transcription antitermination factor NusG